MTADVFTWKMSEMVTEFRFLTGTRSTEQLTDTSIRKFINDYYQNYFPEQARVDDLDAFLTQAVSSVDSGEFAIAQTTLKIEEPITLDNNKICLYFDKKLFFDTYPEDEQFITAPGLAIGSTDVKAVEHDTFDYSIADNSYNKLTSEVSFSGLDTVPQSKYGAFSLTIDTDGTITINQAGANSTGYDTQALAIAALSVADASEAYMGYVTVISTDAGGFVPGTTDLDDAAVTDTYTDGQPARRNKPEAILQFGDILYTRPKSDDTHQIKFAITKRPDAIDAGAPLDIKWGPVIAAGSAILYLGRNGEKLPDNLQSIFDFRMNSIRSKKKTRNQAKTTKPSF